MDFGSEIACCCCSFSALALFHSSLFSHWCARRFGCSLSALQLSELIDVRGSWSNFVVEWIWNNWSIVILHVRWKFVYWNRKRIHNLGIVDFIAKVHTVVHLNLKRHKKKKKEKQKMNIPISVIKKKIFSNETTQWQK